MKEKKKIVFFILSLTKGGAEHVISNMANDYFADRYDVTIITCMKAPVEYSIRHDVTILTLDEKEEEARQGMGKRFLRRRSRLCKALSEIKPEIVISFLPEPNFICLSLRKKLKIPMIISVRNDPKKEYAGKVRTILMKHFYPKADGYVFQTGQAKEYFNFSKHIQEKSTIIMNPLANEYLKEEPDFETKRNSHTIINVGRLENQKDQKTLIQAFSNVADKYPEWKLNIYGEGTLRNDLQKQIDECGCTGKITLCGNTNEMREVMQNSAVFVLSSLYEGMPNVMLEAMSMGMAVIATDCPCGGPATLLANKEAGLLVPVRDVDALEQALCKVLGNQELREQYGRNAVNIKEEHIPEKIYGVWDDLVINTIAANGRK